MLNNSDHDPFGDVPAEAFGRLAAVHGDLDATVLTAAVRIGRASARVVDHILGAAAQAGLSPARWRVLVTLALLAPTEGIRAGELADRLQVRQATATRLVDALVGAKLVQRRRDRGDRRVVRLALSTAGRARVESALPDLGERASVLVLGLGGVTAAEQLAATLDAAIGPGASHAG